MVLRVSLVNSILRILLTGTYHQLKRQLSPQKIIAMTQNWRVHLLSVPNIWRNPMTLLLPAWQVKLVHQLRQRQLRQRQLHQRQLRQRQYLHVLQKMDHVPTSMLLAAEIKLASQIQILILEASYVKHCPPLQPLRPVLQTTAPPHQQQAAAVSLIHLQDSSEIIDTLKISYKRPKEWKSCTRNWKRKVSGHQHFSTMDLLSSKTAPLLPRFTAHWGSKL